MNRLNLPLSFECAETHSHYLPHAPDPRWAEAKRVAEDINRTKVLDPQTGERIYDPLVDSLVGNLLALAKEREHVPEPTNWTPPQRCVWRSAIKVPHERRWEIVHDMTTHPTLRAFATVRQSRWLVLCPFPGCNGAQLASYLSRRFWCVDCHSRAAEGKWVEVLWPQEPTEVERWLRGRPTQAKNWNPGETEEDIVQQDTAHMSHNQTTSTVSTPEG